MNTKKKPAYLMTAEQAESVAAKSRAKKYRTANAKAHAELMLASSIGAINTLAVEPAMDAETKARAVRQMTPVETIPAEKRVNAVVSMESRETRAMVDDAASTRAQRRFITNTHGVERKDVETAKRRHKKHVAKLGDAEKAMEQARLARYGAIAKSAAVFNRIQQPTTERPSPFAPLATPRKQSIAKVARLRAEAQAHYEATRSLVDNTEANARAAEKRNATRAAQEQEQKTVKRIQTLVAANARHLVPEAMAKAKAKDDKTTKVLHYVNPLHEVGQASFERNDKYQYSIHSYRTKVRAMSVNVAEKKLASSKRDIEYMKEELVIEAESAIGEGIMKIMIRFPDKTADLMAKFAMGFRLPAITRFLYREALRACDRRISRMATLEVLTEPSFFNAFTDDPEQDGALNAIFIKSHCDAIRARIADIVSRGNGYVRRDAVKHLATLNLAESYAIAAVDNCPADMGQDGYVFKDGIRVFTPKAIWCKVDGLRQFIGGFDSLLWR